MERGIGTENGECEWGMENGNNDGVMVLGQGIGTGNRNGNRELEPGMGISNGELEQEMGMRNGNEKWERKMGMGNGNEKWEREMGTRNGNGKWEWEMERTGTAIGNWELELVRGNANW